MEAASLDSLSPLPPSAPDADPAAARGLFVPGRVRRRAADGWRLLLDFLYPPSCPACMRATAQHDALCAQCWSGLALIDRPFCERLGLPFEVDLGAPILSAAALADPPVFQRARAAVRYEAAARRLVHRLKYGDRMELARLMAGMMVRAGRDLFPDADLVVPVPLHARRLLSRRFNQAALLGTRLSALIGLPCALSVLERRKATHTQVGLSRAQRAANLQGAFHVAAQRRATVEGRRILLVDDVLTTGATANACARALLRAGARDVDVLVFARVVAAG